MKSSIFLVFILFISTVLFAQYQNPPSLKWSEVKTPHFIVVFPESIQQKGIYMANLLEKAYSPASRSLNTSVKRIPVFLFNQTVISNGYTALAPRNMGYYSTPPQDALLVGGTDWLEILTIHEFRHAAQFQKLDQNINSFVGSLFGDYGKLFCMYATIPLWVLEGDAVCNETIYSLEGRGRLPSFTRDIRALEQEGHRYSYYKAYLGSYRDYFPDHYHLGYLMTSYIRREYGDSIWNRIMDRTTWTPFYPFIFSNSLKHYTGSSLRKTYMNCLNELDSLCPSDVSFVTNSYFTNITNSDRKIYTSYSFPFVTSNGEVLALRRGLSDPPAIVSLKKGSEKEWITIDPIDRIHSNGKVVVWASASADIRWGQRSYANILLFDIKSNKLRYVTQKGKYFAPAISPDGEHIAAIKYGEDMICSLVVLNSADGREEFYYKFDAGQFTRMPSWSRDGAKIVLTVTSGQQRNISVVNIADKTLSQITPYSTESITNPVFYSHYVLFNSTLTGIDAIHALDLTTQVRSIIATGRYGVYNPGISDDEMQLVFQNYTTHGNDIVLQDIDPRQWEKLPGYHSKNNPFIDPLILQEKGHALFDTLELSTYDSLKINKYRPLLHSLNIHSWAPMPIINGIELNLYSNDILNTTSLTAGIDYFSNDAAFREFLNLSYGQFFPVFNFGLSNGQNYELGKDSIGGNSGYNKLYETVINTGITLPFDFSRHIYSTALSVGVGYNYIYQRYPAAGPGHAAGVFDISVLEFTLRFSRARQAALRDLYPRFSQEVDLTYWNSPFADEKGQSRLILNGRILLPGLAKHHALQLSAGMEKNTEIFRKGIYKLTTDLEFVRGYEREASDMIGRCAVDYSLPLFYPDLDLGGLFYLKRVTANLFYDQGLTELNDSRQLYNSVGMDLNFDFHLLTNLLPFQMGVRYSYRLKDQGHKFEVLFLGVSF